jgi:hypothetical protein
MYDERGEDARCYTVAAIVAELASPAHITAPGTHARTHRRHPTHRTASHRYHYRLITAGLDQLF